MVQQLRSEQPQYSCVVSIASLTGRADEEIVTFGASAEDARNQAEHLLGNQYGCDSDAIAKLLLQANIEPLAHWCAPKNPQSEA